MRTRNNCNLDFEEQNGTGCWGNFFVRYDVESGREVPSYTINESLFVE